MWRICRRILEQAGVATQVILLPDTHRTKQIFFPQCAARQGTTIRQYHQVGARLPGLRARSECRSLAGPVALDLYFLRAALR